MRLKSPVLKTGSFGSSSAAFRSRDSTVATLWPSAVAKLAIFSAFALARSPAPQRLECRPNRFVDVREIGDVGRLVLELPEQVVVVLIVLERQRQQERLV